MENCYLCRPSWARELRAHTNAYITITQESQPAERAFRGSSKSKSTEPETETESETELSRVRVRVIDREGEGSICCCC